MTVKELIKQLLDCDPHATVILHKELGYNIYLNTSITGVHQTGTYSDCFVNLEFDFPTDKIEVIRK